MGMQMSENMIKALMVGNKELNEQLQYNINS